MNDFDDPDELSPAARMLLDETRSLHDPSPADRDRVKRAMLGAIVGGAGLAATTAASSTAAAAGTTVAAGGISLGLKIGAVLLVAGAVGGTALVVTAPDRAPPAATHAGAARPRPARVVAATPAPAIEVAREAVAAPEPARVEPPPTATPTPAARVPRAAQREPLPLIEPAATPSSLTAELALLRRAQRAIAADDPTSALRHLDELAARFPDGIMAEEREAARVVALCEGGRRDEARATAQRFLRERHDSPLRSRVSAACP